MTYKEELTNANTLLGSDNLCRFVGYGLSTGKALGTLAGVAAEQIVEMPVAENLMVGFALGLSLKGLKPVVFLERMDFLLNAVDAIVNQVDAIRHISRGEVTPAVIIRTTVGNTKRPLYSGRQHTQDFSHEVASMVTFPTYMLHREESIIEAYQFAKENLEKGLSTMLVEYRDLYI